MNSTAPAPLPPARTLRLPVLVLFAGLLLTLFLWSQAKQQINTELQQEFESEAIDLTDIVDRRLDAEAERMRGLKGFFAASAEVSRDEFRTYVQALNFTQAENEDARQMGFAALSYHQIIHAAELPAHLAKMRSQGFPDYQIQPAGAREVYAPLVYIEPFEDKNRAVLGFDPLTVSTERVAIERARDTDSITISGKLTLAQDAKQPTLGFVIYAPLYKQNAAHETVAQRRANFIGWVDAPYRINDLMKHIFPFGVQDVQLDIYDDQLVAPENLFYQSNQEVKNLLRANGGAEFKSVQHVKFAGRTWSLVFCSEAGYGGREIREKSELIGSVGVLVSLLLALSTAFVVQTQRRRSLAAAQQAELLKEHQLAEQQSLSNRALRDSEIAARLAMESANDALAKLKVHKFALDQHLIMSSTDVEGCITLVNDKFCQISGYSRAELMGKNHRVLDSTTHGKDFWKDMYELITQGALWQGEVCNHKRTGELYWIQMTVVPLMGDDGKPEQYIAMSTDITARKLAEVSLRDSEFRWKFAIEGSGYGLWDWNLLDNSVYFSESWKEIFCFSADDQPIGRTEWRRRLQPQEYEQMMAALQAHLDGEALFFSSEYRARCNDGSTKWIFDRGMVVSRDTEGKPLRMIGTSVDITQRKSNELALLESQRIAQLGSWTLDIASGQLTWTDEIYRLFELDPAEFSPSYDAFLSAIHPEDRENVNSVYIQSVAEKAPYQVVHRLRMEDGRIKWVQERGVTEFDVVGTPLVSRGTVQDITERKLAELDLQNYRDHLEAMVEQQTAHLHAAQQKLELITNSVPGAVYQFLRSPQGDWKFIYISQGIEDLYEVTVEEAYQDSSVLSNCVFEEDRMSRQRSIERAYHDSSDWWHEHRIRTRSGKVKWIRGEAAIQLLPDGAVMWNGLLTDVTARKAIENAALAANRAKSEFLANMSHEIRTPMNGVIGMVDILQQTPLTPNQHRMLRTINESSQALLSILNDILDYSKIEAGKLAIESIPTQLREVAEGVTQLMSTVAQAKFIDLFVFISPKLPLWVATDPTRVRQILLNLLGNAVKFTQAQAESPGRVELRIEPCSLPDGSRGIQLRVLDTGIGMNADVLKKLFQPFTQADESTARKFGGTGLGLSITHRLVDMMHGEVSVRSVEGEGSEFTVQLPLIYANAGYALPALPDLTGVQLLMVVCDAITAEIISEYASAAGATISVLPSVEALENALSSLETSGNRVVLLGMLASEAYPEFSLPAGVGLVRLGRRGANVAPDQINVLARPILQHDLLHGIALASGRAVHASANPSDRRRVIAGNEAPSVEEAVRRGQLILLAEDNETNREVVQEQLRLLGYAAEVAEDGVIALERWRSGRYALLLTDCHMPNMDGFELAAAIRDDEAGKARAPIIAVTANAMEGEAQRCLERGMDDYLAKPLRLNELGAMLEKWLPLTQSILTERQNLLLPGELSLDSNALPVWDADMLARLMGDNPALHRRLLEKFLPSGAQQISEMVAAATAGDIEQVARLAHKLKSAARSVGAMQLGELCQNLEDTGRSEQAAECSMLVDRLHPMFEQVAEAIQRKLQSAA